MTSLRTTVTRPAATSKPVVGLFRRMLDRVIAADAAYRERQKMRRLTDAQLHDMGMTRRDAETGGR